MASSNKRWKTNQDPSPLLRHFHKYHTRVESTMADAVVAMPIAAAAADMDAEVAEGEVM
jgi:hypothetical protein